MDLNFKLNLTQEQKLVMTQEMQLSVKLLQMSAIELNEYVEKEILENPVLEKKEKENTQGNIDEKKEILNYLKFDDYSHNNYTSKDEEISPFLFISKAQSLTEYLNEQLIDAIDDEYMRSICSYMAENLDERGYLSMDIEDIAHELNITLDEANNALAIVQAQEPSGIAARNLSECLYIQLKRKNIVNDTLKEIVYNHLELIALNKYAVLGEKLGITVKEAQNYGDIIKKLNPKPSRGFFTGEMVSYVMPDAYIRKIGSEFIVIMNDNLFPNLFVNSYYKNILNGEKNEAQKFVDNKVNSALFLIKSIEKRKSTVYNVLTEIVKMQKDYFEKGAKYLKPMTLKEIADILKLHESTISRAIKNKYIDTKEGTIKIKDLFTSAIHSELNEEVSAASIKIIIHELISKESKNKPLSDQAICDLINEKGMNIKRRTVAKYREELGIAASSKRKRY